MPAKGAAFIRLARYFISAGLIAFCKFVVPSYFTPTDDDVWVVVVLVVLSLWVENSGLLKAGPRQAEFEPIQAKTYKFSDVHGVDEAKAVGAHAVHLREPLFTNRDSFRNFKRSWTS